MSGTKSMQPAWIRVPGRSEVQWICPPCPKHKTQVTNDLSLACCRVCGKSAPTDTVAFRKGANLTIRMPTTAPAPTPQDKPIPGSAPKLSRNARRKAARAAKQSTAKGSDNGDARVKELEEENKALRLQVGGAGRKKAQTVQVQ